MNRPHKLLALGDIHIFNHKRFDEHKHVFENLYELIINEKPDLIVIAGDVIDSKLRLSPEQIKLCRELLIKLCYFAPVIMIPGNHDTNLQNKERMDSLSPIVLSILSEIKNPINYFKHSGIYDIYDINWAVWSCIDDQKNPFINGYKDNKYTIGLYHGVVAGATTDDNFKLSGGIDVSEFDNCDMVILADIHKAQSFRNGEINYTGSLIQVNVTEAPHGSCLVYTSSPRGYDVEVKRIQNDYSTINVTVGDTIMQPLPTQKIRMKFDTDKVTRSQVMEISKQMKNEFNVKVDVVPIVKKKDKSLIKKDDKADINSNNIIDYFKDFVSKAKERLEIKDVDKDMIKLLSLEKEFSKGEAKTFETGDYSIYKMVINNFLSFGPSDMVVDLDKEGLLGIVGENRVGKSSIIKAMQFALFNEMPNNSTLIKMINKYNRTQPASVEVYIKKENRTYKIKRIITPNKKGTSVDSNLQFLELDDLEIEINNLTKESRPYTETEIHKFLGINETFEMLSVFSAQKRQTEFIDCKNAERLKLVNKFLGLHSFELKEQNVLSALKDRNAVYTSLMKQFDNEVDVESLKNDLKKIEVLLKILLEDEKEIKTEQIEIEDLYKDIITLYNVNLKTSQKRIEEPVALKRKIDDLNVEEIETLQLIEDKKEQGIKVEAEILELEKCFEAKHGLSILSWKSDYTEINELKSKIAVLEHEIIKSRKQIEMTLCNTCGKDFTEEDRDKVLSKIDVWISEKKEHNKVIVSRETEIINTKEEIKIVKELSVKLDNLINRDINRYKNSIKDIKIEIANMQLEMSEYESVQDAKTIVSMLKDKMDEYNNEKKVLSDKLSDVQHKLGNYKSNIKNLTSRIDDRKKKASQLSIIEEELRLLKAYRKIVNKDGLPLYILQSKMDEINDKVNLVVSQVFDFKLNFSIDEQKAELKIQFNYDDELEGNDIGLASGSETFVINVCIKVGLSQISSLPKIDSFFIDEGYDSLDAKTIERLPALFNMLSNYYKNVITISHMEIIKDMCLHQIKLIRKNKHTYIM